MLGLRWIPSTLRAPGGNKYWSRSLGSKPPGTTSQVGITGEGPPPPSRITLDAVPKRLRMFNKVLKVRAVCFDFGVLTRIIKQAELDGLVSGWDPRHQRHQGYEKDAGPVHGAAAWLDGLTGTGLARANKMRGLVAADDSVGDPRKQLSEEVKRVNSKWVRTLLAREQRDILRGMGLNPHGKDRELARRLDEALWHGHGQAPSFQVAAPALHSSDATSAAAAVEAAAILAKSLNLNVQASNVDGGFRLESAKGPAGVAQAPGEDEEGLHGRIGGAAAQSKGGAPAADAFLDGSPKGLPKELSDITTKYRVKLFAKTGLSGVGSKKLSNEPAKGDAEALNIGRANIVQGEMRSVKAGSRWLIGSGVAGVFEYLERRSMGLTLLPAPNGDAADLETFQHQLPAAVKSVLVVPPEIVAGLFKTAGAEAVSRSAKGATKQPPAPSGGFLKSLFFPKSSAALHKERSEKVAKAVAGWRLCVDYVAAESVEGPSQLVVVSDNNELLEAARDSRCHTVAFNPPDQPRVQTSTDEAIEAMADLQHVIERLNGISYRS